MPKSSTFWRTIDLAIFSPDRNNISGSELPPEPSCQDLCGLTITFSNCLALLRLLLAVWKSHLSCRDIKILTQSHLSTWITLRCCDVTRVLKYLLDESPSA